MDIGNRVVKPWCSVGTGWRGVMEGEKRYDICNTLNKDFLKSQGNFLGKEKVEFSGSVVFILFVSMANES